MADLISPRSKQRRRNTSEHLLTASALISSFIMRVSSVPIHACQHATDCQVQYLLALTFARVTVIRLRQRQKRLVCHVQKYKQQILLF